MPKVHLTPLWWVAAGLVLLGVVHAGLGLSAGGWIAGVLYLVVSTTLLIV